jgi:hypothetical protein
MSSCSQKSVFFLISVWGEGLQPGVPHDKEYDTAKNSKDKLFLYLYILFLTRTLSFLFVMINLGRNYRLQYLGLFLHALRSVLTHYKRALECILSHPFLFVTEVILLANVTK